jgi:hypothetical protein
MQNLGEFLCRVQTDYEFYLQFQKNPQEALTQYQLSAEERVALTQSAEQVSSRLAQIMPHLNQLGPTTQVGWIDIGEAAYTESEFSPTTQTALARTVDSVFDPTVVLESSQVKQTLAEIRRASGHADRLTPMLALMEEIG